jgi:hypothetical protein
MNKALKEFKQLDVHEMEQFFLKASEYFFDNADDLPNLPALQIARHLSDCYTYMTQRESN